MLAGHCDQIGLMVKHIDTEGFLRVSPIGGWDVQMLIGQRLQVWTSDGPLLGIMARKPIHLLTQDERKKVPEIKDLWIDIGATDGEEARELVRVGDAVTLDGEVFSAVAPGTIWVHQNAEITDVEMVNYYCSSEDAATITDEDFFGLVVSWSGGGFGDGAEAVEPVRFWLTDDLTVPEDDQDDGTHRMVLDTAPEAGSPVPSPASIGLVDLFGYGLVWDDVDKMDQPTISLENGTYFLMATVETELFGRIVVPAHPNPVEVCFPLPYPGDVVPH